MSPPRSGALALLALVACSYEWHAIRQPQSVPQTVSQPRIDRLASEVQLQSTGGVRFTPDEATRVREDLAAALETVIRPRHPEDTEIARYKVDATLERHGAWSFAYLVLPFAPILGAPTHRVEAKVSLTLQVGGVTYQGDGSTRVLGGLYYNYQTREKAVARAFRDALHRAITAAAVKPS